MQVLILINSLPYGNDRTYYALQKAKEKLNQGKKVVIFLYADGVYNALKAINPAQDEYNPLSDFKFLSKEGVSIYYCQSAGSRRGVDDITADDIFEKSSLANFVMLLNACEKSYCY